MARPRRTDGYAERIMEALERGPRPMSVRQLAKEMGDSRFKDLRGISYGGVRQYAGGGVVNPRMELLRAFSEVLDVRWQWLAYNEGAMTEAEEAARTSTVGQESGADELVEAAFESLRKTVPLQAQLTFEWRQLVAVAIKVAQALLTAREGRRAPVYGAFASDDAGDSTPTTIPSGAKEAYREAGRIVGESIAAPLRLLNAHIPYGDILAAQAYVSAAAHAVEVAAHYARPAAGSKSKPGQKGKAASQRAKQNRQDPDAAAG